MNANKELRRHMKAVVICCPECGKRMEIGFDSIAKDFYTQCNNSKCDFDGWVADDLDSLKSELTPPTKARGV